nr:type II toxin-antitoxin system YoeB family toxin [Treponema saccharophilum]
METARFVSLWRRKQANRLVYKVDDDKLYIVQCGTHYHQGK